MRWTLIIDCRGHTGAENMNTDYALLRRAEQGVGFVRLYRWDPPCLSFGRNEPVARRYNLERIRSLGLDTVRRPTGGRAVWHEHEVTYSVAAPTAALGSLREAYREIHRVIGGALRAMGADVVLADDRRPTPGVAAGACFTAPVGGELVSNRRKIVGSAQYRLGSALLQHGSILLQDGQNVVAGVIRGNAPESVSGDLATVLGRPVTFAETSKTVGQAMRAAFAGQWDLKESSYLEPECYNFDDPDWTWRR